jgi:hypothetical protein
VNEITSIAEALGGETSLGRTVHTIVDMKAVWRSMSRIVYIAWLALWPLLSTSSAATRTRSAG